MTTRTLPVFTPRWSRLPHGSQYRAVHEALAQFVREEKIDRTPSKADRHSEDSEQFRRTGDAHA